MSGSVFGRVGDFEIDTTQRAAARGCRLDGRALDEFPPIEVNTSVIAQTLGSAEVRLGATHVLVGVKAEVESPDAQHPEEGRIRVGVEISACAAPGSDARDLITLGDAMAAQLQRLLFGRRADGGAANLDTRALCVIRGRSCWTVYVDCVVLCAGGALPEALSFAVWAALSDTLLPAVSVADNIEDASAADIEVDDDPYAGVRLDTSRLPVVVGVCQIGRHAMIGCTVMEEAAASGRLLASVNAAGQLCGIQKSGRTAMELSRVQHMIATAQKVGAVVLQELQSHMAKQPRR